MGAVGASNMFIMIYQSLWPHINTNMADKHNQMEGNAEFISNFKNVGISTKCKLYENLELQLSHALSELSSVRLNVDLLSKEYNVVQSEPPIDTTRTKQWTQVSYTHQKPPTHQEHSKTADRTLHQHIPETANCFEILTNPSTDLDNYNNLASTEGFLNTNLRRKKMKPTMCENGNLLMLQQFLPIPETVNRYAPLDKLQEVMEASHNHNHNKTSEVSSTRNLKKFLPRTKKKKIAIKKKIVIIGDSHARGLAAEISSNLGYAFEVTGSVVPGARLENITNLADGEIRSLGKRDTVIVIGGANDINKNEANLGLLHLRKFVENRRNTNIMVVTAPHRYDLKESSCVNNEIVVFNRKLHKVAKSAGNVKILQSTLNRNDLTRNGMHPNISGKEKVAELIRESIVQLMSRKKETPFILKWREEQKDPHQKVTEDNPTNDVSDGTTPEATGSSKKLEETQSKSGNPVLTTSTAQINAPTRTSNRVKKTPTTLNEDFLWITGPLT
jgi:lysophospholipase L1-like esterase